LLETICKETNIGKKADLLRGYIRSAQPSINEIEIFLREQIQNSDSAVWVGICKEIQAAVKRHVRIGYKDFSHFKFMDEELDEIADEQFDEFADQKKVRIGQEEITDESSFLNLTQKEKLDWLESCEKDMERRKLLISMGLNLLKTEKQPFITGQLITILTTYFRKAGLNCTELIAMLRKFISHTDDDVHIKALESLSLFLTKNPRQDKPTIDACLKGLSDRSRRIQVCCAQILRNHYPKETIKFLARLIKNAESDKDCHKIRFSVREFEELNTLFDQKIAEFAEIRNPKKNEEDEENDEESSAKQTNTPKDETPLLQKAYAQISPHFLKLSLLSNVLLCTIIIIIIALSRNQDSGISIETVERYDADIAEYRREINRMDEKLQLLLQDRSEFIDGLSLYLKALETTDPSDYENAFQRLSAHHRKSSEKELAAISEKLAEKIRQKDAGLTFRLLENRYNEAKKKHDIISLSGLLPELESFIKDNPRHPELTKAHSYTNHIKSLQPAAERIKSLQQNLEEALKNSKFTKAEKLLKELRQTRPEEDFLREEELIARRKLGNLLEEIHRCFQGTLRLRENYGEDGDPYYILSWYYLYNELGWPDSAREKFNLFISFPKPSAIFLNPEAFVTLIQHLHKAGKKNTISSLLTLGEKTADEHNNQRNLKAQIMSAVARGYAHTGQSGKALSIIDNITKTPGFRDFATEHARVEAFVDILTNAGKLNDTTVIDDFLQTFNPDNHPEAFVKLKIMRGEYEGIPDFIQKFPSLDSTEIAGMIAAKGQLQAAEQLLDTLSKSVAEKIKQAENATISTMDSEVFQQMEAQKQKQLDAAAVLSGKIIRAWLKIGLLLAEKGADTGKISEKLQPAANGRTPAEIVPAAALSAEIALSHDRNGRHREALKHIQSIVDESSRKYADSGQEIYRVFSLFIAAEAFMNIKEKNNAVQIYALILQLIDRKEWNTEFLLYNLKRPAFIKLTEAYHNAGMPEEAEKTAGLLADYIKGFEAGNHFLKTAADYREAAFVFGLVGKTEQALNLMRQSEERETELMKSAREYQNLARKIDTGHKNK
jgi:hypothetical protein